MDLSRLMELVIEYGYISMFAFNWLLLFGIPIPNEAAAALSGMLTEISYFKPVYAYAAAYLGLISSNTFAYVLGRILGQRLLHRLEKTWLNKAIQRFSLFLDKYGKIAISFSFFLPGIRWAMPYVVGANRYPFGHYALYAYTAGSIWMFIYFNIGRTFPYAYESIINHLQGFLLSISSLIIIGSVIRFYWLSKNQRS